MLLIASQQCLQARLDRWTLERGGGGGGGLALMIVNALAVAKTWCVRCFGKTFNNLALDIRLAHTRPVCDAWGGLNMHSQPFFSRCLISRLASDGFDTS